MISCYGDDKTLTKRMLVSNIACLFDILGWCSPAIIQMNILLHSLWENCLKCNDAVRREVERVWKRWHKELLLLKDFNITRPYFPIVAVITDVQLHAQLQKA